MLNTITTWPPAYRLAWIGLLLFSLCGGMPSSSACRPPQMTIVVMTGHTACHCHDGSTPSLSQKVFHCEDRNKIRCEIAALWKQSRDGEAAFDIFPMPTEHMVSCVFRLRDRGAPELMPFGLVQSGGRARGPNGTTHFPHLQKIKASVRHI